MSQPDREDFPVCACGDPEVERVRTDRGGDGCPGCGEYFLQLEAWEQHEEPNYYPAWDPFDGRDPFEDER